jgi:hypothetical protein
MKQSINFSTFCDSFSDGYKDNFSYDGKRALFNYFEDYESDCNEEIELDPIAFCCEYTEYDSLQEFHDNYDKEQYPNFDKIRNYTDIIEITGTERFIIRTF